MEDLYSAEKGAGTTEETGGTIGVLWVGPKRRRIAQKTDLPLNCRLSVIFKTNQAFFRLLWV